MKRSKVQPIRRAVYEVRAPGAYAVLLARASMLVRFPQGATAGQRAGILAQARRRLARSRWRFMPAGEITAVVQGRIVKLQTLRPTRTFSAASPSAAPEPR